MKLQFIGLSLLLSLLFSAVQAGSVEEGIVDRIKAVGTVCLAGDACAEASAVAAAGPQSAEDVYNGSCAACHASGAAGAPLFRSAGDWADRLAAGRDVLYANAINGVGAMPAKGLCMNCSDDELIDAVNYMIEGL